jgi:hypothetical protein
VETPAAETPVAEATEATEAPSAPAAGETETGQEG